MSSTFSISRTSTSSNCPCFLLGDLVCFTYWTMSDNTISTSRFYS